MYWFTPVGLLVNAAQGAIEAKFSKSAFPFIGKRGENGISI
jgi:hypothetical protein